MVPPSGSQTGRVTPRVTVKATSSRVPDRASILATPRSRSSWRLAMLSASPVQRVATQLTQVPPCTTPTLKVQSSVVMASISTTRRAISRMAERPSARRAPAWLGRPTASRLKRAIAERQVVAALHVQDAGPPAAPVLAPPGQQRQRADRMHGVQMAEHEDAGPVGLRVREAGA